MVEHVQDNLESDRSSVKLFEAVTPELYRQNAFRVLGLPVGATMRDIKRRQAKLKMRERLGVNSTSDKGGYLPLKPPPDEDDIAKAIQRLQDPETRLLDELFWFWPRELGSSEDDGLKLLAENKVNDALSLWAKYEEHGTTDRVSTHNIAVLYHALALDLEHKATSGSLNERQIEVYRRCWKGAYKRWAKLLYDEGFWSRLAARIRMLNDPRLTTGSAHRIQNSLPKALLLINARLALQAAEKGKKQGVQRHIMLMQKSSFDQVLINEALRDALSNIRQRIKMICAPVESKANENPERADKVARQLLKDAKPLLSIIDQLLPEEDLTRAGAHDEVAVKALQCQSVYVSKTEDWKRFLEQLENILPLAASKNILSRIEENIEIAKKLIKIKMCFFCEQDQGDDNAAIEVAMYGNVMRIPTGWNQIRITWQHTKVKVPRCSECKSYHDMMRNWVIFFGMAGGIIGVLLGLPTIVWDPPCFILLLPAAFATIGALVGRAIAHQKVPYEIRLLRDKKEFHLVKELKSQGWEFGERPPQQ